MTDSYRLITQGVIDDLTSQAQGSFRLRKNKNYHMSNNDPVQRMLNAFEPNTYVRPHKHEAPDKREVFIVLRGRLLVVFYKPDGTMFDAVVLDSLKGNYAVEIPERMWHSATGLDKGTVVYELKDGPYSPDDDKCFASWAPEEVSQERFEFLSHMKAEASKFLGYKL